MLLPDVNVLVAAHKRGAQGHAEHRAWLEEQLSGPMPFGISEAVLSGFVRVVTHPRVFDRPSTPEEALAFTHEVLGAPATVVLRPGHRYWAVFSSLCLQAQARGNLVADAAHAALAIEHDCTWVSHDRDYARFPGLRWEPPRLPASP